MGMTSIFVSGFLGTEFNMPHHYSSFQSKWKHQVQLLFAMIPLAVHKCTSLNVMHRHWCHGLILLARCRLLSVSPLRKRLLGSCHRRTGQGRLPIATVDIPSSFRSEQSLLDEGL